MMLRTTSGLSRSVLKWVSQVTASLGATLSATLIWSAVPHPGAAPAPALTSGGKFAARAVESVAYDGLDTMPLPHLAPAPARFVALPVEAAPPAILRRASWDETAPLPPAPERASRVVGRPTPHVPSRVEAHRAEPAPGVAAAAEPAAAETPEPEPRADGSFLHRVIPSSLPRILPAIVATAQDAWTVTASAGDVLVAHVVPRIP